MMIQKLTKSADKSNSNIIFQVFMIYSEYRQLTCYRIMFCIGVNDCLQLIVHLLFPLFSLVGLEYPYWFEKV